MITVCFTVGFFIRGTRERRERERERAQNSRREARTGERSASRSKIREYGREKTSTTTSTTTIFLPVDTGITRRGCCWWCCWRGCYHRFAIEQRSKPLERRRPSLVPPRDKLRPPDSTITPSLSANLLARSFLSPSLSPFARSLLLLSRATEELIIRLPFYSLPLRFLGLPSIRDPRSPCISWTGNESRKTRER